MQHFMKILSKNIQLLEKNFIQETTEKRNNFKNNPRKLKKIKK